MVWQTGARHTQHATQTTNSANLHTYDKSPSETQPTNDFLTWEILTRSAISKPRRVLIIPVCELKGNRLQLKGFKVSSKFKKRYSSKWHVYWQQEFRSLRVEPEARRIPGSCKGDRDSTARNTCSQKEWVIAHADKQHAKPCGTER